MRLPRFVSYLLALLAAAWVTGCTARQLMVKEFVGMVQTGLPAVEQEQDLQLLAHSLPAHIKLLETVLASDPHNADLLVLLARLYGGYAFAVLETEFEARHLDQPSVLSLALGNDALEDAMARYFERGANYALRALEARHTQARLELERPQSADLLLKSLSIEDVPALFWYGFNLGGYVQHRLDAVTALAKAHLVEQTMHRVVALDEAYYQGSAHLVLLAYYAARSPMTGGNPNQAAYHYQRHQNIVPRPMGLRRLFWARYVLVLRQERQLFVRQLTEVGKSVPSGKVGGLLASVAATRARIYLGAVDQFFD